MDKIIQALKSRTVVFAIIQAVIGISILVFTEADFPAIALMIKSVADIALRADTKVSLSDK